MPRYRNIIFLDDPADFDKWYVEWDEGIQEGFDYLLQWEYGETGEIRDTPSWGTSDAVVTVFDGGQNEYVISYNWGLSYVSLTEVIR